jgi:hypothetical protein
VNTTEALLKGILATVGRTAFPPEKLYKIVAPTVGSAKQVLAYNMCDGETPQAEIGKRAKLDKSNLSKTIAKWVETGVVIRVGADGHLLHLYPLTTNPKKEEA